jgi:sigma-E factor negative regulatory protein RseC
MLEEIATVMKTEADGVWLKTQSVSSCNACQSNNDCGTGVVAKALTPRDNLFFVRSPLQLLAGQKVKIAVSEQHLVSAAALLYLLPLFCLIAVAALLSQLQLAEGTVILGSLAALACGFVFARSFNGSSKQQEQIEILQILPDLAVQHIRITD